MEELKLLLLKIKMTPKERRAIIRQLNVMSETYSQHHRKEMFPLTTLFQTELQELINNYILENINLISKYEDVFPSYESHGKINCHFTFCGKTIQYTGKKEIDASLKFIFKDENVPTNLQVEYKNLKKLDNDLDVLLSDVRKIISYALEKYSSPDYLILAIPEMKPFVPKECLNKDFKPKNIKVYSRDEFLPLGLDLNKLTIFAGRASIDGVL